MTAPPITRPRSVVIGVSLPRDTYEAFVKRVPKSRRDRSKVINLLLKLYLENKVVLNTSY
jgi:metal-responsive CopG/Arc/MetJ family transcriptional regulator